MHQAARTAAAAPKPVFSSYMACGALDASDNIGDMPPAPIGARAPGGIEKMLEDRTRVAEPNGMPRVAAEELQALAFECDDVFGLRPGPQLASAFPPLVAQMLADVKAARARARPMPAAQRTFTRAQVLL